MTLFEHLRDVHRVTIDGPDSRVKFAHDRDHGRDANRDVKVWDHEHQDVGGLLEALDKLAEAMSESERRDTVLRYSLVRGGLGSELVNAWPQIRAVLVEAHAACDDLNDVNLAEALVPFFPVLDPFAGIGTVPYVAVKHGRQGLGIELKPEYFSQAIRNLYVAGSQLSLFDMSEPASAIVNLPTCVGCGRPWSEVDLAVSNDRGEFCGDCREIGLRAAR